MIPYIALALYLWAAVSIGFLVATITLYAADEGYVPKPSPLAVLLLAVAGGLLWAIVVPAVMAIVFAPKLRRALRGAPDDIDYSKARP